MNDADRTNTGILVPEHFIPTPRGISPQAQAWLSTPPPFAMEPEPPLHDKEGWRTHAERGNRNITTYLSRSATTYPADTVTHALSATNLYEIVPQTISPDNDGRVILFIHGGGFYLGGGEAAKYQALPIAAAARTRTFSIDYRMPPSHPFPAGLDDTVEAYRWLLERYKPENIAFYGPSAGGNLAAACILKARDMGLPMPAACVLHTPASDMTELGDTFQTNVIIDTVLVRRSTALFLLYAGGHDLKDPLLSPLFADYGKGFPPTILTSGTRDLFLSNTVRVHRKLRQAGVVADLHVFEGQSHAQYAGDPNAPETKEHFDELTKFFDRYLGK